MRTETWYRARRALSECGASAPLFDTLREESGGKPPHSKARPARQQQGKFPGSMLAQQGPEALTARCEAARVLGLIPPPSALHDRLPELLHDEAPEVVEQALLSAGKSLKVDLLPRVIEMLRQPKLAAAAGAALVQYDLRAVDMLQARLNDATVPLPIRKRIPGILVRIASRESAAALAHSLVQRDPGLRYDVLKALNKLRERDPGLLLETVGYSDLVDVELIGYTRSFQIRALLESPAQSADRQGGKRLLQRAFHEHMDQELERIFRLFALTYPPRDMHNAFIGLVSHRRYLQANALEMLEHVLPQDLFRRLANVLDAEVSAEQRLGFARRFCGSDVNSLPEALRILLHSEDRWLRACAVYTVGGLRLRELSAETTRVACEGDTLLSETRIWALARLSSE